jgi:acetyl-CoA carboxylase carboxyltransferase component
MFLTGPQVIKTYTGEDVAFDKLGGADIHNSISGVADFVAENDEECLQMIRELLGFLPSNCFEDFAFVENGDNSIEENIIDIDIDLSNHRKAYDMHEIIKPVVDNGYFFEVKPNFAQNIIVGFSRLAGRTIGIVANQPNALAGSLDADCSNKAARFIRFCDAFNISIVTFVDVPGFLPGIQQEHRGVIKHGAKMLFAYSEATVPKITIIIRKAYGGAFLAMCSKDLGADQVFALPTAEIAVIGPEGAINIIFKSENNEMRKQKIDEYRDKFANPYFAASRGHIDAVIEPQEMRLRLISALRMLSKKIEERPGKKHGIIPL